MSGGIENLVFAGIDVAARGAALASGDHALVAAVHVHGKDLVTFKRVAGGLEDQPLAVGREVRFRVLTAEGELADVAQVFFFGSP